MAGRTISAAEARAFYDRLGAGQDRQAFYEDGAVSALLAHASLEQAAAVFEFGCGTGRVAARMLGDRLPGACRYRGVDVSETMVMLARRRLAPWGARAEVQLTDGAPVLDAPDGGFDRFVSTFVFDLLSDEALAGVLAEAHRILAPRGVLAVTSATPGRDAVSRIVSAAALFVNRLAPTVLGGCRPIVIAPLLAPDAWRFVHHEVVRSWGVSAEVLVAERLP